ncbi:TonB-dependent receptor [Methylocucumis oryzae]|uniref:TonB-dependent receptor n=1 Tax=Methylocucumis oryzae TaxID=1632867 RepID=UPI001EF9EB47|nr:TonB-dependent receptor [Methylocucumis oryzae]
MNVLAKGDRPDIDYDTYPSRRVQLAGYVTVDLRAAWHITKAFSIAAKLNNLLDQNYQTAYSYYTPHRNFFIDLHYTGTLFLGD